MGDKPPLRRLLPSQIVQKTKRKTPRGRSLPKGCRALISSVALDRPNVDRAELANELPDILKKAGFGKPPTKTTLEKMISKARNGTSLEDGPWHIGTLKEYPIAPEALPLVLAIARQHMLTIRDAKWVGRLYCVRSQGAKIKAELNDHRSQAAQRYADVRDVFTIAHSYAVWECAYGIVNRKEPVPFPFDSRWLDNLHFGTNLSDGALDYAPNMLACEGIRSLEDGKFLVDSIQFPGQPNNEEEGAQ